MTASYFVIGASHRSCSGAIRDRLTTEEAEVPAMLERLSAAGITQAMWLSTCDRVEVQAVHERPNEAALTIAGIMAERVGLSEADLAGQLYTLTGPAAVPVGGGGPRRRGKALVARGLHAASPRYAGPFVPVHCGAIPAELLADA